MTTNDEPKHCVWNDNLPALCVQRFKCIEDKLENMHEDMRGLVVKVTNGITAKIITLEMQQKEFEHELTARAKRIARWETAIISTVVTTAAAGVVFLVQHFMNHP